MRSVVSNEVPVAYPGNILLFVFLSFLNSTFDFELKIDN